MQITQEAILEQKKREQFFTLSNEPLKTYSQLGEDVSIIHLLNHQSNGRYVDAGCHHPFRFSNTALLHAALGWSGVNIDADLRAIEAFREHRPNDRNIHCAIGPEDGDVEFAVFGEGAINSASPERNEANRAYFGEPTMQRVRMKPLQNILDECLEVDETFDFLNVDVEGLDLQVLLTLNWTKHRPKVVAVEIHGFKLADPFASETLRFMVQQGYALASFIIVTAIFVRNEG